MDARAAALTPPAAPFRVAGDGLAIAQVVPFSTGERGADRMLQSWWESHNLERTRSPFACHRAQCMAIETRAGGPARRLEIEFFSSHVSAVAREKTAHLAPGVHRHSGRGENHGTDRGLPGLSIAAGPDPRRGKLVLHGHRRSRLDWGAVGLKFAPECGMGNAAATRWVLIATRPTRCRSEALRVISMIGANHQDRSTRVITVRPASP